MLDLSNYRPAELYEHPDFTAALLHEKDTLVIPSQGEHDTKVLVGQEGEMLYEHRQAGEVTKPNGGVFVSRVLPPVAEIAYHEALFGDQNPVWLVPENKVNGVPLDKLVLNDYALIEKLGEYASQNNLQLHGFNQTSEMQSIADAIGVRYYGNHHFANWAGTKNGLISFLDECGVATPQSFAFNNPKDMQKHARDLLQSNFSRAVIKVGHSTGAMGIKTVDLLEVARANDMTEIGLSANFLPVEFNEVEGAVIQGWIPKGTAVSLSTFVDFDGSYTFTGAQMQLLSEGDPPASAGAMTIDEKFLPSVLEVGHKLAQGYVRNHAYGPHGMDMIIPDPEICEQLGLKPGEPLCHDENTRPTATTIARAWLYAIKGEYIGTGWIDTKVKLPSGTSIADVIGKLAADKLLISETGPNVSGVFPYNGSVLDARHEQACYLLANSGNNDPIEALQIAKLAAKSLKGYLVGDM